MQPVSYFCIFKHRAYSSLTKAYLKKKCVISTFKSKRENWRRESIHSSYITRWTLQILSLQLSNEVKWDGQGTWISWVKQQIHSNCWQKNFMGRDIPRCYCSSKLILGFYFPPAFTLVSFSVYSLTLKMEVICSSETFVRLSMDYTELYPRI
jgi:hypothetical protein